MQPENWPESPYYFQYMAGKGPTDVTIFGNPANYDFPATQSLCSSSFYPWEVSEITDSSSPQARALAASKNHKEAEKRRRERINSHLDKLRNLLPCNSKTDKASLLGKVIQRVKELKQETSDLMQLETVPSEVDEISVHRLNQPHSSNAEGGGELLIKACVCCEDRPDLIPGLIETLRSVGLKLLRAEMATLGGRTRSVLIVSGHGDGGELGQSSDELVQFLRDGLKALVHRSDLRDRSKRPRVLLT